MRRGSSSAASSSAWPNASAAAVPFVAKRADDAEQRPGIVGVRLLFDGVGQFRQARRVRPIGDRQPETAEVVFRNAASAGSGSKTHGQEVIRGGIERLGEFEYGSVPLTMPGPRFPTIVGIPVDRLGNRVDRFGEIGPGSHERKFPGIRSFAD